MAKDLDWDELYRYVKSEILNYSDKKMPSYMVLRLRGLNEGKFYANKKTKPQGTYEYKLILLTFKLLKGTILNCLNNTEIKDEQHKVNLIMKLIESEINNVKDRIEAKKKNEEKIHNTDLSNQSNEQSDYIKKSKDKNKKLDNLW